MSFRRRFLLPGLALLIAASTIGASPTAEAVTVAPHVSSATGRVTTIGPQDDFRSAVLSLTSGDTLLLAPGTYETGYQRFYAGPFNPPRTRGLMHSGSAAAPITISAVDPANPPLLRGGIQFQGPDYIRLLHLRVEATDPTLPALTMKDGRGWVVQGCEFFGAANTHSLANVAILGGSDKMRPGQPSGFVFRENSVHDASNTKQTNHTEHNMYVSFAGSLHSGGVITRNVIWGHYGGEGIKIGDGGAYGAPGPWNVTVSMNTIAEGGRQVLLHGNVRNIIVFGNLFWKATQAFNKDPRTTMVYIHQVTGSGNQVRNNYGYSASMLMFDIDSPLNNAKSKVANKANIMTNAAAGNPLFVGANTSLGWKTRNPKVAAYGRWGNGKF